MVIVKCPECGVEFIVNAKKCKPKDEEFDLAKVVNEVMQDIALEQGEIGCYA